MFCACRFGKWKSTSADGDAVLLIQTAADRDKQREWHITFRPWIIYRDKRGGGRQGRSEKRLELKKIKINHISSRNRLHYLFIQRADTFPPRQIYIYIYIISKWVNTNRSNTIIYYIIISNIHSVENVQYNINTDHRLGSITRLRLKRVYSLSRYHLQQLMRIIVHA